MVGLEVTNKEQRGRNSLFFTAIAFMIIMGASAQVSAQLHPADTDGDYRISLAELTAYAAAWKGGTTWPMPPNPIPQAYVTNAESLWQAGEAYRYDATKTPPWVASGITPEQRMKALDDVSAKWSSISAADPDKRNQQMVAFLATRPEFEANGISDDGDGVWARFTNGRLVIISDIDASASDNITPLQVQDSLSSQDSSGGSGLPEKKDVFIYGGLGPVTEVAKMFTDHNYINKGADTMVVNTLMGSVKDAAVLYIKNHSATFGTLRDGTTVFSIWTNTQVTPELDGPDSPLNYDLDNGLIAYSSGKHGPKYFLLTQKFFEEHMTFGKNAFVFLDACRSDNSGIKKVFLSKGAVYAGWDGPVEAACGYNRALDLFGLLLGENEYLEKPPTPYRPFDYESVLKAIDPCPCGDDILYPCKANLVIFPPQDGDFQILAPSIRYMMMSAGEKLDELTISGIFGDDQTDAKVTVQGEPCPITGWKQEDGPNAVISCNINRTGPGSAGEVQVEINGHKSNIVPLTEWKDVKFTYTVNGPGDLYAKATFKVRLRGDVHKFRTWPNQTPYFVGTQMWETMDSSGWFDAGDAGGKFEDSDTTTTWSVGKACSFTPLPLGAPSLGPWFDMVANLLPNIPDVESMFAFDSLTVSPLHWVRVDKKTGSSDSGFSAFGFDMPNGEGGQMEPKLHMNDDYSIDGGSLGPVATDLTITGYAGVPADTITAKLEWTKMTPTPMTTPTDETPGDPWPLASADSGKQALTAGSGAAIRDLADCYSPSASSSLATAVTPGGITLAYAVEDSPPTGWTVGNIGTGGVWDNVNKKVKWGLFFDSTPRTLTYQAAPLTGDTGIKSFSGTVSFDGTNVAIGGESSLGLCAGTETISTPSTPAGPLNGSTSISYSYTTGGSTSSIGDNIEYQFDWKGDGLDVSNWGSSSQSKIWSTAGTYYVKTRARCSLHNDIKSSWSDSHTVTISSLPTQYTLTVNISGSGSVSKNPNKSTYNDGEQVILKATPDSGYSFSGWSGDSDCSDGAVTMNADKTCTATFNLQAEGYTLTVTKSGTGNGTVTSSPAGINCGSDCSETYSKVQKVRLTAKADANSTFAGWAGGSCSGTKTCQVTVDAVIPVTATFDKKVPDISVSLNSLEFGSVKVGRSLKKTLKIMNAGTGDLSVSIGGLSGTGFSGTGSMNITVKPKKSYNLGINFKPASTGEKTATLVINSNDPDAQTINISLSGTGI
jgi:hypothetical protein